MKQQCFNLGKELVQKFCLVNELSIPIINTVTKQNWYFDCCAYYRPIEPNKPLQKKGYSAGINICLEKTQTPCNNSQSRNWSWPGYKTDRTPIGVLAHELGHHCDYLLSKRKGTYFGDFSSSFVKQVKEQPISGYSPNYAEVFAEWFRLFVTNHSLLALIRPKTHKLFREHFTPISHENWKNNLFFNPPQKILKAIQNLIPKE